jgi:hypothetical protein
MRPLRDQLAVAIPGMDICEHRATQLPTGPQFICQSRNLLIEDASDALWPPRCVGADPVQNRAT